MVKSDHIAVPNLGSRGRVLRFVGDLSGQAILVLHDAADEVLERRVQVFAVFRTGLEVRYLVVHGELASGLLVDNDFVD